MGGGKKMTRVILRISRTDYREWRWKTVPARIDNTFLPTLKAGGKQLTFLPDWCRAEITEIQDLTFGVIPKLLPCEAIKELLSKQLNLTLYGEPLKIYPQVKFLGIIFDSKLTFQKHFEDVLERCNSRYHRLRLLANKKWGPSPATLIQIYKQCVRPVFEYGSLSTITASDNIISKIQRLQNKFIRFALRLPKYIIPRLLHDSTGLPYVKDRLLTYATKSLDRIAQNPPVEASISSHRHNPGWDRFPTPLSVVRPEDS